MCFIVCVQQQKVKGQIRKLLTFATVLETKELLLYKPTAHP